MFKRIVLGLFTLIIGVQCLAVEEQILLDQAIEHFNKEEWKEAEKCLLEEIGNSGDPEAVALLSSVYVNQNNIEQALNYGHKAADEHDNEYARLILMRLYTKMTIYAGNFFDKIKFDLALKYAQLSADKDNNIEGMVYLADLYNALGNKQKAAHYYEKAFMCRGDEHVPYTQEKFINIGLNAAFFYKESNDIESALRLWTQLAEEYHDIDALVKLVSLHINLDHDDLAQKYSYQIAQAGFFSDAGFSNASYVAQGRYFLATRYHKYKKHAKAKELCLRLLHEDGVAGNAYALLAELIRCADNNVEESKKYYHIAADEFDNPLAMIDLARIIYGEENKDLALAYAQKAFDMRKNELWKNDAGFDHEECGLYLAHIYEQKQEDEKCFETCKIIYDEYGSAKAAHNLGLCYKYLHNNDTEAEQYFIEGAQKNYADSCKELWGLYKGLEKSYPYLEQLVEKHNDLWAMMTLGMSLYNTQPDKAKDILQRAKQAFQHPRVDHLLGMIKYAEGDKKAGLALMQQAAEQGDPAAAYALLRTVPVFDCIYLREISEEQVQKYEEMLSKIPYVRSWSSEGYSDKINGYVLDLSHAVNGDPILNGQILLTSDSLSENTLRESVRKLLKGPRNIIPDVDFFSMLPITIFFLNVYTQVEVGDDEVAEVDDLFIIDNRGGVKTIGNKMDRILTNKMLEYEKKYFELIGSKSIKNLSSQYNVPELLRRAKEDNDAESCLTLGQIYTEKGDLEKAHHYLRKSAEQDYAYGLYNLGVFYEMNGDIEPALYCYLRAADEHKIANAANAAGMTYLNYKKDRELAKKYLHKAADEGNYRVAMNNLSSLYAEEGNHVLHKKYQELLEQKASMQ